jgi:polyisoprenoid-binding protein YceI
MLLQRTRSAAAVMATWPASLILSTPAQADRFEFDSRRTEVRFVYTMGLSTQRGRFTRVSGTLDLDAAKPEKTTVAASIATESLTTGEPMVDSELKSASFFNAKASPVIAFKSRAVRLGTDFAGDVMGDITVNGVTKPVTLKVSVVPHDDPALKYDAGARAFTARTRIKRSQFNMTDYASMVADEVDIEILAIARPKK